MTVLYHSQGVSLPVGFSLIAKTGVYTDQKDGQEKRRSPVGKNEYYRQMLKQAMANQIPFKYVLNDVRFASAENMRFVKHDLHKEFVIPLKANCKVALGLTDKQQGRYGRVDTLELEPNAVREVYPEGVNFPLMFVKQVFVNGDNSTGILYLVSSDTTLNYDALVALYRKRWNVEPYHKSSNRTPRWKSRPLKRLGLKPTISLPLCAATSNLNC